MIRKVCFAISVLCCLWACKDDEVSFDVPVPEEGITFEPMPGGAIMRYTLPQNTDISAICVRYVDEQGRENIVKGSIYADSITLTGFHAPHEEVRAQITVTDNNDVESAPIERTFSTLVSAPYAFMDSVQVLSSWNGVLLEYSYTGVPSGIVDVYRVGQNPFTKEIDTLFVSYFTIAAGEVSTFMEIPTDSTQGDETTIVLRSEDGNGNFVRSAIFPGLTQFATVQYPSDQLTVSDPGGFSHEDESLSIGIQYLLDGDTKGKITMYQEFMREYFTYVTEANGNGSYVQLELDEPQVIASVRVYAALRNSRKMWNLVPYFNLNYEDRLPNHIRIVASNDPSLPLEEWDEIGNFFQQKNGNGDCWMLQGAFIASTPEEYDSMDPRFAEVVCEVSDTEYKYVRVVSEDHFRTNTYVGDNLADYISYHELEVYVKAEE